MISCSRLLSAALAVACVLIAAGGTAADAVVTESLGTYYERTGFESLLARADGGITAVQGRRIETFRADGTIDPNGLSGKAPSGGLFALADGKTLAVGNKTMSRFNPDGSLDKSFGGTGTIERPSGAEAVAELGSGRIALLSTGVVGARTPSPYASVRLLSQDGSTVKDGGFSVSLPTLGGGVGVSEVSPIGDGGALVVGAGFIFELRADGSLNRDFGDSGLIHDRSGFAGGHILPDGSIEIVGSTREDSVGKVDLALYRYTASGTPELDFGPEAMRRFDLGGGWDVAEVASWGADGSVVVGGRTEAPGPCPEDECEEAPFLAAFNAAGDWETGFGEGGTLRLGTLAGLPNGYRSQGVTSMVRRHDGSIVAAGNAPPNETTGFLAAVSPQGALVGGFGEGGIVRALQPLRAQQKVVGFQPLPDGKLLAAGTTDVGIADQPVLIRYAADGSLDRSFGDGNGYLVLRQPQSHSSHGATGFAVRRHEVLTGVYGFPGSLVVMSHLDGSPVAAFGSDGAVDLPREVGPQAMAFAADGDPLVLGIQHIAGPFSDEPGVVLRYRPDGAPDSTFADGGRFTMRLSGQAVRGRALLATPGGRVLAGGSLGHRFAMVRLLADGRPDPRFGSGGWSVVKAGSPTHALVLKRVGSHIYLAGTVGEERGEYWPVLMRFDLDGHPDETFGRRGRLVAPQTSWAHPTSIIRTRRGILVVMSGGPRPLLTFTASGKVRSRSVGSGSPLVENLRATVSEGHLVLGWSQFDRALGRSLYHLTRRPL